MGKYGKKMLAIWLVASLLIPSTVITADEAAVQSMEILTMPKITEYCVGEQIDTTGLSLLLTYESDETKSITEGYEVLYDFSTAGEKIVTVNFEANGRVFTEDYPVTVYPKPSFLVESKEVERGRSFSVPIQIVKNCGLMGFDIRVSYDKEYLEPIEVIPGELLSDEGINDSIAVATDNFFDVVWAGAENMKSDGELFHVQFMLKSTAPDGTTEINITSNQENTYNEQYHTISIDAGVSRVYSTMPTGIKKKSLEGLSVSMDDWVYGKRASVPVLVGNSGNGRVTYTYSDQIKGIYRGEIPTKPGRYYLKATVSETDDYFGGVATCTFEIIDETKKNSELNNGGKTSGNDNLKLPSPKIKKIKNKNKKVIITLSKKMTNISGYEIQYSTKKNFKNANTVSGSKTKKVFTIKGVKKKKKYYVRIRAYRKKGSVIYCSKWSNKRQIKIKK